MSYGRFCVRMPGFSARVRSQIQTHAAAAAGLRHVSSGQRAGSSPGCRGQRAGCRGLMSASVLYQEQRAVTVFSAGMCAGLGGYRGAAEAGHLMDPVWNKQRAAMMEQLCAFVI